MILNILLTIGVIIHAIICIAFPIKVICYNKFNYSTTTMNTLIWRIVIYVVLVTFAYLKCSNVRLLILALEIAVFLIEAVLIRNKIKDREEHIVWDEKLGRLNNKNFIKNHRFTQKKKLTQIRGVSFFMYRKNRRFLHIQQD